MSRNRPLSSTQGHRPLSAMHSDTSMLTNRGFGRPSTASSASSGDRRTSTPSRITHEGEQVRSMMKQRISRRLSVHRESSFSVQQSAIAEFHRRHGINVMRQRMRTMFYLFQRKAWAVGHLIYWCKQWKKEIESQVRNEDWYMYGEKLLSDSSKLVSEDELHKHAEFVTLAKVHGKGDELVELRFNKNDFRIDRKIQSSVLSPAARETLTSKLPYQRTPQEVLEIVRCLKQLSCFCRFSLELQKEIATSALFDCYEKNRVLSRHGRRSDGWYIVLYGKLLLRPPPRSKNREFDADGSTIDKKFVGVGQIYGEDEVVMKLTRSDTTIVAEDNTEILFIWARDYLEAKDRLEGRCRLKDVRRTFSANPILQHFDTDRFKNHERSWQVNNFQSGAVIASKIPARLVDDPKGSDFAVSNITASDLIDSHTLEQEKAKHFCVVQKGSAEIYGVCEESNFRKEERHWTEPCNEERRSLTMRHPSENEHRKLAKNSQDNADTESGFKILLPETLKTIPVFSNIQGNIPRRYLRRTPFSSDPKVNPNGVLSSQLYEDVAAGEVQGKFVQDQPTQDRGEKVPTIAKIGHAEPGTIFGMEATVSAELKNWQENKDTGIQANALGVNKQPDIYFVSNGCQVILVNKNVYAQGIGRDAKCLTASQMPNYRDAASILKAKDDNMAWTAKKDHIREYYRKMMASAAKRPLSAARL